MAGTFGLTGSNNQAIVAARLVEARPCIDVFELYRQGLLAGASARLQIGSRACRLAVREAGEIEIDGNRIGTRSHALGMQIFICPRCQCDAYRLYEVGGVWICRRCAKLEHSSRHRFRSVGGYSRLLWLRRRLSSPRRSRKEKRALIAQIRILEAQLIRHLRHNVNDVLERRHAREQQQRHRQGDD